MNPYFSASELLEDRRNNQKYKKLRDEVSHLNIDKLDAKLFIRRYVSEIYKCHKNVRNWTQKYLDEHLENLLKEERAFCKNKKDKTAHICLIKRVEGKVIKEAAIDNKFLTEQLSLRERWQGLGSLPRIYVSNEIIRAKDVYQGSGESLWIPD